MEDPAMALVLMIACMEGIAFQRMDSGNMWCVSRRQRGEMEGNKKASPKAQLTHLRKTSSTKKIPKADVQADVQGKVRLYSLRG